MTKAASALRRSCGATFLALGLTLLAGMPMARAAAPGITGTVQDGKGNPVAGVAVTIVFFNDQGRMGIDQATSAADGSFDSVPPSAATGYQVQATYRHVSYTSAATQLLPGQPSVAQVTVYDPTRDPSTVSQTSWIVWIDSEKGGMAVQEDFEWTGTGSTAYIGSNGTGEGVVTVPLPAGATDLQFLGAFLDQRGSVTDGAYVSSAPIVPGASSATIRYSTPTVTDVPLNVQFETTGIQLFVPSDLSASAPGLRLAGTTTDQGVTYQVYTADSLQPGATMLVKVTGGSAATSPEKAATDSTVMLVGVAGAAALAAFGFWFLGRRRSRTQPASRPAAASTRVAAKAKQPASKNGSARSGTASRPERRPAPARTAPRSDDDIQLLIDEIAALDLSHDKGLLDSHTYKRLRVAAKDRLIEAQQTHGSGVR